MAGIEIDGVNNKIDLDDDKDTSISANVDDTLVVEVGGTNIATITSTSVAINDGTTITTDDNSDTLTLKSTDNDASVAPVLLFNRDSASPAANDFLGTIIFSGQDDAGNETDFLTFQVNASDVANGAEDGFMRIMMPVASTSTEFIRMNPAGVVFNEGSSSNLDFRVESNQNENAIKVDSANDRVHLGTSSSFGTFLNISGGSTHDIGIENSTGSKTQIIAKNNSSSHSTQIMILQSIRTSTAFFEYFRFISNDGGDTDMLADGNGALKMDGAVTTGGVDYAEFFEWKDGNSSDEDRRGHSVILDENKIIVATSSDDTSKIIGVVSTNPTVVGGGDMEKWVHKYLKDDYDSFVWEEHTVTEWTDEDGKKHSYQTDKIPTDLSVPSDAIVISEEEDKYGNTVKLKRKKLNPEWDSNKQYISREDRKEWEAIGLMGKLRLKKGEPTNPNWIKLRDISETVEEWLVR